MQMAVKNIVFDFGGVVVDFNPDRSLKNHFPKELHDTVNNAFFESKEWKEMDRGTYEVEEAVRIMCSHLPEELRSEAAKMVFDRKTEMPPIEEMYSVVEALHNNGYKIYMLSNCPMWFPEFKKDVPVFNFFDGFVISAEYGQIKPEEPIFRTLFEKFSLIPSECFFIDDMQANIDTGKRLGMKTHCFADRNIESLKNALRAEGVKI